MVKDLARVNKAKRDEEFGMLKLGITGYLFPKGIRKKKENLKN